MTAKKQNNAVTGKDTSSTVQQKTLIRDRRALLRGAVTAAPMILTLQSGAALARSSNLVSAASPANAKDLNGNTLCMDTTFASSIDGEVYDLGETPYASVTAIPDRTYTVEPGGDSSSIVTTSEMCEQGGVYYYNGDQQVSVQQGMLVSATALTSFVGRGARIDITNI